mgnify:CR=1 FL=1
MTTLELTGVVVRGQGLGAKLGFPTANLAFSGQPPQRGVWAVEVKGLGPAVCNVGVRPTVAGEARLQVEVHILNFDGDLYGKTLKLVFLKRLRGEKKFASLEALKEQIARDVAGLTEK